MIKDKKERSMTIRLTSEDYAWLEKASFAMGSNPSRFVRQLIQMAINATIQAERENQKKVLQSKVNM